MTTHGRNLKAVTYDPSSTNRIPTDSNDEDEPADENDGASGLFNFRGWYNSNPILYKPNFSSNYFIHNGQCFHWSMDQRPSMCGEGKDQFIVIRCFGRSAKPIKDLLYAVRRHTTIRGQSTTQVYRSSRSGTGDVQWLRQSIRPSRPMSTVSLVQQQKKRVIRDMNNYLKMSTWYAERGIPYRRGYLFHGPPGTGKTSLSFALAGLFGLSIYCVLLGQTDLTECDLATLFESLPQRCIVLLEDIDITGIHKRGKELISTSNSGEGFDSEAVLLRSMGANPHHNFRQTPKSPISLSSLLNIIDGAASHEVSFCIARLGYNTVMTLN